MTSLDVRPQSTALREFLRSSAAQWMGRFFRHQTLFERAVRGVQVDAVRDFDAFVAQPLLRMIGANLAAVRRQDVRTGNLLTDLSPALQVMRRDVEQIVQRGTASVHRTMQDRIEDLAREDVRWVFESVRRRGDEPFGAGVLDGVADRVARQAREGLVLGDRTEDWFRSLLQEPTARVVRSWVTTAVKEGLTIDETVRGLVGTRTQTGILEKPRHAARALVRTEATHAGSIAKRDSYKALGITHVRFVATLDLRTSVQCAAEDGSVYPIDEAPQPPLHPNCRSILVPLLGPVQKPFGKRAALDGQVPADVSYEEWLGTRSKADQDTVLGKTRAAAWRAGRLTLRDILGRDGLPLSIPELRRLDKIGDDD